MLFDRITETARDKALTRWQVAADGNWSQAQKVRIQPGGAELNDLVTWIDKAPDNVALEAFFKNDKDQFIMFGIRFTHLSKPKKKRFLQAVLSKVQAGARLEDVLGTVREALNNSDILTGDPGHMMIGKEGFWKEFPSLEIWTPLQGRLKSPDEIKAEAPRLTESFSTATMVEYEWLPGAEQPFQAWVGIPVSEKRGENYVFSDALYDRLTLAEG